MVSPADFNTVVAVQVPGRPPGRKCWAKALSGVDLGKTGGYAFDGVFLERAATYRLPDRMMVVTCERTEPDEEAGEKAVSTVTLWRVDAAADGGLDLLRTWTNRSGRIGRQILKGVASRLAKDDPPRAVPGVHGVAPTVPLPRRVNQRWDTCSACKQSVPPRGGTLIRRVSRTTGRTYTVVEHTVCPPRPNEFAGRCSDCLGWLNAREGIIVKDEGSGRWRPRHDPHCPDVPADPPAPSGPLVNRFAGPCEVCWQHIRAGDGELLGPRGDRHLTHRGRCPTNPYNPAGEPVWVLNEVATAAYDFPAGTVARVSLPDGPADGPGWREPQGTATEVSVIGVVVAVANRAVTDQLGRRSDRTITVWRVATTKEAAPVLDGEAARLHRAGVAVHARRLLALLPGAAPADATAPTEAEMLDVQLAGLPTIPAPLGAARPETVIYLDEPAALVWTVVHNRAADDDWDLSNWGGAIAYRHPLTAERTELLSELRGLTRPPA